MITELQVKTFQKWLFIICLCFISGMLIGYIYFLENKPKLLPVRPIIELKESSSDRFPLWMNETLKKACRKYLKKKFRLKAGKFKQELSLDDLGIRIDFQRLREIYSYHQRIERFPLYIDSKVMIKALLYIKDRFDIFPQDAKLDLERGRVLPERKGRILRIYSTMENIRTSIEKGIMEARLDSMEVKPKLVSTQIKSIDIKEILGYFKTRYNRTEEFKDRNHNLKLAASQLNGHIIMPQQVFDFNQVLGERSEIRGYRYAPIIVQGRLVQGIGGGTCQIASTLHAAAFFAGLEILERRPHTRPSYYIKVGLDATVVYPHINLRLKNPYQFPVVIKFEVKDGWTSAFILGKKRIKKVTFIRKILAETPYEIQEIEDSTLPRGIKILEQRGIPGYKVRRDRILQQGTRWIRERSIDLYPPTPEIIRIGTGNMKKDSVKLPKEDTHPPYTVKRYLKMSQMNNP